MRKSTLATIFLMLITLPLASAEISYENGRVSINGRHQLKDIKNTDYLEIKEGVCYLKKPINIRKGASFYISNDSCEKLNLYADAMVTIQGGISFNNLIVTSYDPATGKQIEITRETYNTKRPDIATKEGTRYFNAYNTEFSYLGYYYDIKDSHFGITLRYTPKAFITDSKFHHNYFGLYTFDSKNVQVRNSEVHSNLEYGLDFHDYSDYFYIYNNTVYNNGNHGIIVSKFCDNNVIVENKVFDHTDNAFVKGVVQDYGVHGIMLHLQSNNNSIERNELWNNRVAIKTDDSHNNTILKNIIYSDLEGGIEIRESTGNLILENEVISSQDVALFSGNSVKNHYENNYWGEQENQVYFRIIHSNGTAFRYKQPGTSDADAKLTELSSTMEIT